MEEHEYKIMYDLEQSYWWFSGKRFLVENNLKRLGFDGLENRRILDVGSGTGIILKTLQGFGVSWGAEISREAIRFLRKRNLERLVCCDVNEPLPFRDNSFSLVTCLDVLEHVDRDGDLLMELFRVCEPGGYVFITVPAFHFFWSPHDVALHHRRRYLRGQLVNRMEGVSAKVIKASYYNTVLSLPIAIVRKLKALCAGNEKAKSDLFFTLPEALNRVLSAVFKLEIYFLNFVDFPFGVSLLVIASKDEEEKRGCSNP
jgi:ubiquinone/menaquinone biosynthesis C-methylase UbiE